MRNEQILKAFSALSFDGTSVTRAPAPEPSDLQPRVTPNAGLPDETTKAKDFGEVLYQRYTAPYAFSAAYRHWGINE
jgi:hypothetical protein